MPTSQLWILQRGRCIEIAAPHQWYWLYWRISKAAVLPQCADSCTGNFSYPFCSPGHSRISGLAEEMNGLQSSRAESFSQSWDHDMTEESSYANPTGWGDNKSDRCTTLLSAHFTKKDWPTQTKLTDISALKLEWANFTRLGLTVNQTEHPFRKHLALSIQASFQFVKQKNILTKVASLSMSLPLRCEVSEIAPLANVVPCYYVVSADSLLHMSGDTERGVVLLEASPG